MYDDMEWTGVFKAMPESFDLRDIGVVPKVRNQGNWGTCWGFASIAGCETSILSRLNMTTDEYLARYGKEMDLSGRMWLNSSMRNAVFPTSFPTTTLA